MIEIEFTPVHELAYVNNFGVYACTTEEKDKVELNNYGNFVIRGTMQQLSLNEKYKAKLTLTTHKKYGKGYDVVEAIQRDMPKTNEEQETFLRSILTEHQADLILNAFPFDDLARKINHDELDIRGIKGLGRKTYEKIRDKVIENYGMQEILSDLSPYGFTYKIIRRVIKHFNNSPALAVQKIKYDPYALTSVRGLGFLTVDKYAINMGIKKDAPERINAAIGHVLRESENQGDCWLRRDTMVREAVSLTRLDARKINSHLHDNLIDQNEIYMDDERIGQMKLYKYEQDIAQKLNELINCPVRHLTQDIESKIQEAEQEQGIVYTDEQREAIKRIVENNVVIITGKGGTGKSTILKGAMRVLDDYSYMTCALSGKAAQRIVESTGLKSGTIHRVLEFNPAMGFTYHRDNPLSYDIVALDEASMVNISIFHHLITAIKQGTKLIIQGDVGQLPPIGAGFIFKDLIESKKVHVVELTQVHRQAQKSGILSTANAVREGKQIMREGEGSRVVGELKDLYLMPKYTSEDIFRDIQRLCLNNVDKFDLMEFQVISPTKDRGLLSTRSLNEMMQKIFNHSDSPSIQVNGYAMKVGDKVIQTGNNYDAFVFNGTLGTIESVNVKDRGVEVQFVGRDEYVYYEGDDLNQIDMAYALTVHRMQGSEMDDVIFAVDYAGYSLLSRQLIYTALTRAKKKCVVMCHPKALKYGISQDHSTNRNTFLPNFMEEVV